MNAPFATERKSFLPLRLRSDTVVEVRPKTIAPRPISPVSMPTPLAVQNGAQPTFKIADRVLVNGLKSGTLRYVGTVHFAQGLFCGIELDEPDGKHDGQVNNTRYFQCKANYGVFVPHDKVIIEPPKRISSTQRTTSRLRPPTMTRSLTFSSVMSSTTKPSPMKPSQTSNHLPDIIPSSTAPNSSTSAIETFKPPMIGENHDMSKTQIETQTTLEQTTTESPAPLIDEVLEPVDADFSDSVSLILHQLQQEQKPHTMRLNSSITNSEAGTIDDDDDCDDENDDTDEFDTQSVAESVMNEQRQPNVSRLPSITDSTKSIQTDLSFDIHDNITFVKNNLLASKSLTLSNRSLNSSTRLITKPKTNLKENTNSVNMKVPGIPSPGSLVKKDRERISSMSSKTGQNTPQKSSLVPPKRAPLPPSTSLKSTKQTSAMGSSTKLNKLLSPTTSLGSSYSDLTSSQTSISKSILKPSLGTGRAKLHSVDLSQDKNTNKVSPCNDAIEQQMIAQRALNKSLATDNEYLKKQYQQLIQGFDVMHILSQYYIAQNEQRQKQFESRFAKIRLVNFRLKASNEKIQTSNKKQLDTLNEQYQSQLNKLTKAHKDKINECQQDIDNLLKEKTELETRSKSLQEQVDRFLEEMANSDQADPLLRRVETLEKDKASLQTVLEFRNQELTQLRTKINEQVFQREDQLALERRINMAENRNQDLVCLLRNLQLNEKAVAVERDQLKEQVAQLERDKQQLVFENETLLYRIRERCMSISIVSTTKLNSDSVSISKSGERSHSLQSIFKANTHENEHLKRSLSLKCFSSR